ncbi:MAG TPA: helix-turn-helix domain-containing protein [Solirubrobacterales bacterium]|nr:helix-turn-helix domain-containing protein [Solirubrobacterales bacterium]
MTAEDWNREKRLDEQLAPLVACSNTIKVLTILAERPASPKEIASLLDLTIPAVSHHFKKLVRLGMVELIEERDVGGAIQHVYCAVVHPVVGNEEWEKLSLAERQRFSIWIFQLILADAARSFDAALFDACSNNHLSRIAMAVDQRGFDEVAEIQDRALGEIFEAQALSGERIAGGEGVGVNIVAAMMCFELPGEVKCMKVQEVSSTVPALAIRKSN